MRIILKIIATIIFLIIWGNIQRGCTDSSREIYNQHRGADGTSFGHLFNILSGYALLFAGIYGIWKFNPNSKNNDENQKLDKS
jgi:succinate dehydrogenase/fumarate reductase cytochrome b subunit